MQSWWELKNNRPNSEQYKSSTIKKWKQNKQKNKIVILPNTEHPFTESCIKLNKLSWNLFFFKLHTKQHAFYHALVSSWINLQMCHQAGILPSRCTIDSHVTFNTWQSCYRCEAILVVYGAVLLQVYSSPTCVQGSPVTSAQQSYMCTGQPCYQCTAVLHVYRAALLPVHSSPTCIQGSPVTSAQQSYMYMGSPVTSV